MDIAEAKRHAPRVRDSSFSTPQIFMARRILIAGLATVLIAGAAWALFSAQLYLDGHAPDRVLPPLRAETYYRAQAWFLAPLLVCLWLVLSWVAYRLTGGLRRGPFRLLAGWLGVAYGLALLVCFIGPEWLVYDGLGIAGVRAVVRYTGPLLVLGAWALTTVVLRFVRGVPLLRAVGIALVALLAQALLGAPWLR